MSYRMICGCILLIAVVLTVIYTDKYMSQLAAPHYAILANSIEDVSANPNIKSYVTKGFNTAVYVLVSVEL